MDIEASVDRKTGRVTQVSLGAITFEEERVLSAIVYGIMNRCTFQVTDDTGHTKFQFDEEE